MGVMDFAVLLDGRCLGWQGSKLSKSTSEEGVGDQGLALTSVTPSSRL